MLPKAIIGAHAKPDGLDCHALKKLIAGAQVVAAMNVDDKSDAYLDALVAMAVKNADRAAAERDATRAGQTPKVEPISERLEKLENEHAKVAAKLFSGLL